MGAVKPARLGGRIVEAFQRAYRHPAFRPQPRAVGVINFDRQENAGAWRRIRNRAQDRVEVEGEASRGLPLNTGSLGTRPIPSAPPKLAADAAREQGEADAGLVFEAPVL